MPNHAFERGNPRNGPNHNLWEDYDGKRRRMDNIRPAVPPNQKRLNLDDVWRDDQPRP